MDWANNTINTLFRMPLSLMVMRLIMLLKRSFSVAVVVLLALSITACGHMSNRGRDTAIGAGIGAVGGAVLTGGSTVGTLGGAAVGGVIGHQISR